MQATKAAAGVKKYDLSKWKYAELRDVINTSCGEKSSTYPVSPHSKNSVCTLTRPSNAHLVIKALIEGRFFQWRLHHKIIYSFQPPH